MWDADWLNRVTEERELELSCYVSHRYYLDEETLRYREKSKGCYSEKSDDSVGNFLERSVCLSWFFSWRTIGVVFLLL